jgi:hypothetical protein
MKSSLDFLRGKKEGQKSELLFLLQLKKLSGIEVNEVMGKRIGMLRGKFDREVKAAGKKLWD